MPHSPSPIILIVDDDEPLRSALASLVRSMGYLARIFSSAEDLISDGGAAAVDCIITDVQMPGMSGIELEQHLRAAGVTTPIIMVTARTEADLLRAAEASSALCVLRKPFDTAALEACLARALA